MLPSPHHAHATTARTRILTHLSLRRMPPEYAAVRCRAAAASLTESSSSSA